MKIIQLINTDNNYKYQLKTYVRSYKFQFNKVLNIWTSTENVISRGKINKIK